jgi:hypothetical protein
MDTSCLIFLILSHVALSRTMHVKKDDASYTIDAQIKQANRNGRIIGISCLDQSGHDQIRTRTNQSTGSTNNAGKRQGNEQFLGLNTNVFRPLLDNGNHDDNNGCIVQKSGENGNWYHETQLCRSFRFGTSKNFGHVKVQCATRNRTTRQEK